MLMQCYLSNVGMNFHSVYIYFVSSKSSEYFKPLCHLNTLIIQDTEPLGAHSKALLLLRGVGDVVDDPEVVGGIIALLLHHGHRHRDLVNVRQGKATSQHVGSQWLILNN